MKFLLLLINFKDFRLQTKKKVKQEKRKSNNNILFDTIWQMLFKKISSSLKSFIFSVMKSFFDKFSDKRVFQ